MKIAILGGSFDPPHLGHLLIAQQVKEYLLMDQIWLLPNHEHAFDKIMSPAKTRLEMTNLLTGNNIVISEYEIKKKGISYTIDTLRSLTKQYPNNIFYWVLGSDQINEFQKYKDWEEIRDIYNMIIFPRENALDTLDDKIKKAFNLKVIPKNITILQNKDLALTNISSSMIRNRIKKGLSINNLVLKEVEEYIKNNKLYI
ncbi:MAG TPA: nicotinate (nicotinamide) nucleotide adenylyltransferase [Candidatus Limnocylindrales bacterium]|nr:nicotinate (nicotinamide) nucleotide adenylyltransferase [Candidatus Limnocylindrales bacterium]